MAKRTFLRWLSDQVKKLSRKPKPVGLDKRLTAGVNLSVKPLNPVTGAIPC